MGLFSSSPAEKEIYKFVGGLFLKSYYLGLLNLNGLFDIVNEESNYLIAHSIQKILEYKTKNKIIGAKDVEPELYILIKKAIFIHECGGEFHANFCPKCNNPLKYSVCTSCGYNVIEEYRITYNQIDNIKVKMPKGNNPYNDMDTVINLYIKRRGTAYLNKIFVELNGSSKLTTSPIKAKNISSNKSTGVQDIINHIPINSSIPKTYTLEDFEFNIPQGFVSDIEYGYDSKVIKAKNNENVEITILFKHAPNCFTLEQGYYYSFILADRVDELTNVPPDTYECFPQNLVLNINGVDGIFLDESYELTIGKIFNRYNFVFTKNEKNYFIKVNVEKINKHINIKDLLEEILPNE